jgi:hypothetical protein
MTSSANFPPILVFDAVSGEYRDPSDSADTTAKIAAPTRTVLVTGGTHAKTNKQTSVCSTDRVAKPADSSVGKYNVNSQERDGKPLVQA